jgi:hypothetical protein
VPWAQRKAGEDGGRADPLIDQIMLEPLIQFRSFPFDRLYCYAQKHVRSIKAVTKDPGEITEKRYRSIRRLNKPNKKLKIRNFHHSSPYHVSDHKAAITVGVIMGVFLGKASSSSVRHCLFKAQSGKEVPRRSPAHRNLLNFRLMGPWNVLREP